MKPPQGWFMDDACYSIFYALRCAICLECGTRLLQHKSLNKLKHLVDGFRGKQLFSQVVEVLPENQVCLRDRIGEIADREGIKSRRPSLLEGNDEHPAAIPGWYGDRLGADTADPGISARLNLLQGFIIVNRLGVLGQVYDDLGISVRQESVQVVGGAEAFGIDQILDEVIQRKIWFISAKYHLSKYISLNLIGY